MKFSFGGALMRKERSMNSSQNTAVAQPPIMFPRLFNFSISIYFVFVLRLTAENPFSLNASNTFIMLPFVTRSSAAIVTG